jgi:hypothetical protein
MRDVVMCFCMRLHTAIGGAFAPENVNMINRNALAKRAATATQVKGVHI